MFKLKQPQMTSKITILVFCFSLIGSTIFSQETWSLEKCITHAQNNSLTIKRSQLNVSNAELTEKGNKLERLPFLNASTSASYQFGRTIDPSTNIFRTRSIGTNNISVNAGITLFDGFRINNNIKQAKLDLAAGKADLEDANLTIAVNVAAAYLNILFAEDQIINARNRLRQTQDQLNQTDKLIQAGSLPETDRLQILAQAATDEQSLITQENTVEISYLNLKNLLQLSPDFDLKIEHPDLTTPDISLDVFTFEGIYQQSLLTQPIIKANDLRMKSAFLDEKIARTGMIPTITAFGNIRTDAATMVRDFNNPITDNAFLELGQESPFQVGGVDVLVAPYNVKGIEYPNRSYVDQINDNFGQSVGVSMSIPIYNNSRNRIAVERARLNVINTEITNEETKQQLKADVMRAITDAKAAKKQLDAAQKSLNALEANFSNNERKYKLGAINTFEYTSSKNQLDQARVDHTIAKYDYIYKLKIVDYYRGEKITLK
jgi:outer membrane protein